MSKQRVTITAAWITGGLAVVAAIIIAVATILSQKDTSSTTAVSSGDSSPALAIGGDVKDSKIVLNPSLPPQEGLTEEARTVVNQVLEAMGTIPPTMPELARDNPLVADATTELARDPYNVPALLIRGQAYYTSAMSFGGKGLRESLADFEKAADTDKKLADPRFGIGTVLYQLALFDLAQRNRYKIHEKGGLRFNKETGLMEMRHPRLEFFPDRRNRTLLQAALEEFQTGRKLQQLHQSSQDATIVFFAPRDVENRIRSIRQFLGHEPATERDDELVKTFTMALTKVKPTAFGLLFEIEK